MTSWHRHLYDYKLRRKPQAEDVLKFSVVFGTRIQTKVTVRDSVHLLYSKHSRKASKYLSLIQKEEIVLFCMQHNGMPSLKTEPLIAQCLLYVPPGLTFTNSTFCPHSVFMCFVWISEQTAIFSLYSINWLVFIAETDSVYCAVQTGCLCCLYKFSTSQI
jgi:hypothetical protein